MRKLPKSGGWLNMVKVVFAYIMLAFAMKFLYNIDAYFGWGIITRLGFIAVWVVLALLLGLYFLGVFRTSHDSPTEGIGWAASHLPSTSSPASSEPRCRASRASSPLWTARR